jgi:Xaa-Pro aminopeptidase
MLVTDLVNVRYLSGFTGSNAALLILAEHETPVLATDGRYRT